MTFPSVLRTLTQLFFFLPHNSVTNLPTRTQFVLLIYPDHSLLYTAQVWNNPAPRSAKTLTTQILKMTTVHSKIEPTSTPDKTLFGKLKEIMEWLVGRLEAGISKIMDFMKSRTKTSKPVREVMSSIINDSQSDIGFAGEKCMSLLEDLDPEKQAPALGMWEELWRKITAGAVSLFDIICKGFARVKQGITDMFHVVWQKLKAVFTGIGQAIAGFWGKLMSFFGRHSAHMMYARNPESLGIVS